jgi:hypothetical protein
MIKSSPSDRVTKDLFPITRSIKIALSLKLNPIIENRNQTRVVFGLNPAFFFVVVLGERVEVVGGVLQVQRENVRRFGPVLPVAEP